jgi:hypothetical protein
MAMRVKKGKHHGYSAKNVRHDERDTYLRFVVPDIDEDSLAELGVFHAVWNLRDRGRLDAHEEEEHDRIRIWFEQNLKVPSRFTASKPPHYRRKNKAISWFKSSAHQHVSRVRALVAILKAHGVPVRMIRANRVGYVVYEDEHQIVAERFAGERY